MGAERVRDPIARMSSMSIRDTDGPQAAIDRKRRRQAETVLPRSLNRQLRLLAGSLGRRSSESSAHARGSLHPREIHQSAFVRPEARQRVLRKISEGPLSDRSRELAQAAV